jgi:integrase
MAARTEGEVDGVDHSNYHQERRTRYVVKYRDLSGKSREKWHRRKVDAIDFSRTVEVDKDRGGPLRYTNWRTRIWVRIVERLDFEVLPHDLRRTSTTRLFREDRWTPGEVQEYLGHKDPRTTIKIYDKVNSSDLPQPSTLNTRSR